VVVLVVMMVGSSDNTGLISARVTVVGSGSISGGGVGGGRGGE